MFGRQLLDRRVAPRRLLTERLQVMRSRSPRRSRRCTTASLGRSGSSSQIARTISASVAMSPRYGLRPVSTIEETVVVMGLSSATVNREWAVARAWLYRELTGDETSATPGKDD